ncbi:hypothetical protein CA3LBN_002634 [Candidozyma haemuli]|uniref:Thiamine transporter n=1 Tax=Candidozyma haemuli TaxID=45357 RepID=A0ABX8I4V1_9ASCO|nr:hypothetical protein CA3LBN_002634 [[Candida] haemuloni]
MAKWRQLQKWIEVPSEENEEISFLVNPDLKPVPSEKQTWGFFSFFGYWGVPNATIWTWSTGGALVAVGLTLPYIMGAITVSNVIIIIYTCLNSLPGTKYHIGYPLSQRMLFGIKGSFIGIIVRIVLAIVFFGAQSWLGGCSISLIISGLSKSYLDMPMTFPESVQMKLRDFIGFVIFSFIQACMLVMKPESFNKLLISSCGFTMICFIAMLALCITHNGGSAGMINQDVDLSGDERGWAWLYAMSIWYGAISPEVLNHNDFSRFANSPTKMCCGVASAIMITGTFVPLAGLLCASSTLQSYDKMFWLPTTICLRWMHIDYNASNRAMAVIFGIAFTLSQLSFNIVANGIAGGMEMAGLLPKYINIRRGAYITALLSWAVQPWKFFWDSSTFLDVMSSFGVVATPLIALQIADFMIIRRSILPVDDLYCAHKSGTFYYTKGFNIRAIVVWFVSVVPSIPGLISVESESVDRVPQGLENFYYGNILFAFVIPFVLYVAVCWIWPPQKLSGIEDEGFNTDFEVVNFRAESMSPKGDIME